MADAQRGQFVIDCKSGEAAGIIYGLVHDKTLFRPELDLANAHPKEFDNEHIFPLDMFINSDYMLNKDIALWHVKNDNPPMRVRHILEYIENGEMVGKDVLEYDVSTDKWHRVEEECIELV